MKRKAKNTRKILTALMLVLALLMVEGCFYGQGNTPETPDVCEGVFNDFVSQDREGIGVTSSRCIDSERGDLIDGRCYCHGE